jgi:ParB family chromosome partitioning protein
MSRLSRIIKKNKKALVKGLDALFAQEGIDVNTLKKVESEISNEEIIEVLLTELRHNPLQPLKYFYEEALAELSSSIKEHGVFQPIIIKPSVRGYEIIAGERRYRASQLAGL